MMINQQQKNWLLDAGLWIGFLSLFFLEMTGVALHQVLGIAFGLLGGLHLALHWKWVKAVTQRFFGKSSRQAHIYFLMDAGILGGFLTILISGLGISTWLKLALANYESWHNIHVVGSIFTLVLVVIKLALHWRWIMNTMLRLFTNNPHYDRTPALQPVRISNKINRRHFLSLMSLVGISSAAALLNTFVPNTEPEEPSATNTTNGVISEVSGALSLSNNASTTATCSVRCNKRCSYPGHCRRYADSNQNGKCDLGECL